MKRSNSVQKLIVVITLIIGLSLLLMYWYKQTYSVETAHNFEGYSSSLERKLLITTQNSPFKDSIIGLISAHYKNTTVDVELVDFKALGKKEIADYDAILIMYRWEAGAPPEVIQLFMEQNLSSKKKMVIMTTSWNGLEKMNNVDATTGASILAEVPIYTEKLIKKLDRLLKSFN